MKKKAIHKIKVLTPTENLRMKRLQDELDLEKDEIIASARKQLDAHDAMIGAIVADLRAAREEQNLSLNDLQERTGIDRAHLSRLLSESGGPGNPTMQTLERLAAACGKRVVLSLQDA